MARRRTAQGRPKSGPAEAETSAQAATPHTDPHPTADGAAIADRSAARFVSVAGGDAEPGFTVESRQGNAGEPEPGGTDAGREGSTDFDPERLEAEARPAARRDFRSRHGEMPSPSGADPTPGRGWTERYDQPVKYRRLTGRDARGRDTIMIRFDLAAGEDKPPPEVLEVMQRHKRDWRDEPTGLRYDPLDRKYGKVWKLPDDPLGRETADKIDRDLQGVAAKLAERQAGR